MDVVIRRCRCLTIISSLFTVQLVLELEVADMYMDNTFLC